MLTSFNLFLCYIGWNQTECANTSRLEGVRTGPLDFIAFATAHSLCISQLLLLAQHATGGKSILSLSFHQATVANNIISPGVVWNCWRTWCDYATTFAVNFRAPGEARSLSHRRRPNAVFVDRAGRRTSTRNGRVQFAQL